MTDRPIIFSGPMVRALLDGRKTQTRRVIKPQPDVSLPIGGADFVNQGNPARWCWLNGHDGSILKPFDVPYAVGDRLWCQEDWRVGAWDIKPGGGIALDYPADSLARKVWLPCENEELFQRLVSQSQRDAKKAGLLTDKYYQYAWSPGNSPCRLRRSINMPRWASRLTLTVTDVRVQRVQDISGRDAWAEGVESCPDYGSATAIGWHKMKFHEIFDSINTKRGYGWDQNPWVAAYTFTVKQRNIDA